MPVPAKVRPVPSSSPNGPTLVADAFAPNGNDLERIMYGFSLFVCLPDGLSSPSNVGTGTVMRPSTLQGYGEAAVSARWPAWTMSAVKSDLFSSLRH